MKIFINTISDKLSLISEELSNLPDTFLSSLPKELKGSLHLCAQINNFRYIFFVIY